MELRRWTVENPECTIAADVISGHLAENDITALAHKLEKCKPYKACAEWEPA